MSERLPPWAALARPGSRAGTWLSYLFITGCCALTLLERNLPMRELPQYAALSRMLLHLHDPRYGFDAFYGLDVWRGASVLPLWLWGQLADWIGLPLASRLLAFASVWLLQLGVCAVLRAQRKPVLLSLLGLPFTYASAFYHGLIPSSLSVGLAFWAIAWWMRGDHPRAQGWLLLISVALPLTHPFGMVLVGLYVACSFLTRPRPRWTRLGALSPLALGCVYWLRAALHADGVAAFQSPGLALRVLRAPQVLLAGFQGQGEAWLLVTALVLWIYLCRPVFARMLRLRAPLPAADWWFALTCLLAYLWLPGSTWSTNVIYPRAGGALLAWLPVLVPRAGLRMARRRGPLLLAALAAASICFSATQLTRFSNEASALSAVLAHVPPRPKLLCLTYDNQGHLARSSPYLHVGAYAQAARGGFLSLSRVDYAWTAPLRRRKQAAVPPPAYGSEWDPTLLQHDPALLAFYDTVLVIGKDPHEMTILMNTPFRLVARRGMFMLYARRPG